ncbi:MAG: hypothetical protein AUK33_01075 [Flavobacteriaceae bacterium CG2_30_34_30]|nr:DUF493 domain-containing protein [Flavobacteriia bacterium]OIP52420.1 MAG: hypothetical protein AUK33_01075 [Flavobacteriaceae bacterium CG2_30_34_30]PIQ18639.1 MAG: hypothetical protein COW66_05375 [Flavobacteriaceae bacterium CG18_big_fil_WC_8_21_14_2_50_34_36]PIV49624.1 MAG: DUF493 domain-containing protein [Flavobacteriaceae bacterium CG02_land_8_20_14_3_00_34_13]PIZ07643.1 MAG: DUF493 domain-containing protein [Flavobacteriaceae bacterium CG_4_10_14_0_8_um_filter_34_31]PJC07582.1 MAG: 
MSTDKKTKEFYISLKEKLSNDTLWPSDYLFKFIVPTHKDKVVHIENTFNNLGAVIHTRASSKGNYTSISVQVKMKNPDAVIEKYLEVSIIEGIISL